VCMCCAVDTQLITVKLTVHTANEARSELLLYVCSNSSVTLPGCHTRAITKPLQKPFD
jgi:hypothetical protein